MSESIAQDRARAAKVATWLVEKERPHDAVLLLAAWASNGPNDAAGQALLAQALRLDPSSHEAQLAFERMEGIAGDHRALDEALACFDAQALQKLEAESRKPTFRRAQMGFNNNIKTKGVTFHVQTEDSGLDAPHVITHLFADGGRVVKSHKRSYGDSIEREGEGIGDFVRGLMKAQHMEMVLALRDGRFDAILRGEEVGGMEELSEPPKGDVVQRLSKGRRRTTRRTQVSQAPVSAKESPEAVPLYSLTVVRSLHGGPTQYDVFGEAAVIGVKGEVTVSGEQFCHPEEAVLVLREDRLFLEDLEGGNGVFLRIRTPVELMPADEFLVGDQLLRLDENPEPNDGPDPDPTYFYSSPKWGSSFRVTQLFEGGAFGACVVARGNTLQVGSAVGDLVFAGDPLVAEQHCIIEEQAGIVVLTDLGTHSGVFVRITAEHELVDGDELLVGRTRLMVNLDRKQLASARPPA